MVGDILAAMFRALVVTFFAWLVVGNGHEEQLRQVMLVASIGFFLLYKLAKAVG